MLKPISRKVKAKKLIVGHVLHFPSGGCLVINRITNISDSEIRLHCGKDDSTILELMLEERVEIKNNDG